MKKTINITCLSLFWIWNIVFLIVIFFGAIPEFSRSLIEGFLRGNVPPVFIINFTFLIATPIASIIIALSIFRKQTEKIMRFFCGVELPILLILALQLFLIRELTIPSVFLLGSIISGALVYFYFLVKPARINEVSFLLMGLVFIIALYLGALLLLFVIPAISNILFYLYSYNWAVFFNWLAFEAYISVPKNIVALFSNSILLPLAALLLIITAFLFLISPFVVIRYYLSDWYTEYRKFPKHIAISLTCVTISIWVGIFYFLDQQPQQKAFAIIEKPLTTRKDKEKFLADEEGIKSGLLNAYLHSQRYLAPTDRFHILSEIYIAVFEMSKDNAKIAQSVLNTLISPVLYKGKLNDDERASRLYTFYFDASIQRNEKQTIIQSLNSTILRRSVEASTLDINERKVQLVKQHINTGQNGPVVNVELYEVYQNQTHNMQEIFYNFSLPENAVVTGLWLGDNADRSKRFPYVVAPRGAAQKVYKAEVSRRVDPALLEQVGPRQYRLRVFPVPQKITIRRNRRTITDTTVKQPEMHLWMTYSVLANGKQKLLPELLEKRNIFWTSATERKLNNEKIFVADQWMPEGIKSSNKPITNLSTQIEVGETKYAIRSVPATTENISREKHKIAILVDSSYSMGKIKNKVIEAITWASANKLDADIYVQPDGKPLQKLNINREEHKNIIYFASVKFSELWSQAATLPEKEKYKAVFILTDQGNYGAVDNTLSLSKSDTPTYFIHLGKLAPIYTDPVLKKVMEAKNGVSISLADAYGKFIFRNKLKENQYQSGNMLWTFDKVSEGDEVQVNKSMSPVAAKILIDHLASKITEGSNAELDAIHQIAKTNSVLTPYSSMLVLVNDAQRERLKKAEQEEDRFRRVSEPGTKNVRSRNPLISGVPEPEVWVLIIITLLSLLYFYNRRRELGYGD